MTPILLVGAGGALGSIGRYLCGLLVSRLWPLAFPMGTMLVNIAGSLAMGLFIGWMVRMAPAWQHDARLFFAVGVLGGFTTFSTFSMDVVTLLEGGEFWQAALYVLGSVVVSVVAVLVGLSVMRMGAA